MKRYIRSDISNILEEDYPTLARIASDPNTRPHTLRQLLNYSNIGSYEIKKAIAKNPNATEDILRQLANHEYWGVQEAVATNPNAPIDVVLDTLKSGYDAKIYSQVLKRDPLEPELIDFFIHNARSSVRSLMAYRPELSLEMRQALCSDPDWEVRTDVALSQYTPEEMLRELATDSDLFVRHGVAENYNTPMDVLEILAQDEKTSVRRAAKHMIQWHKDAN